MVVYDVVVEHENTAHQLEFDSEDGLEVLRFQLFSLTLVSPENQTILDSFTKKPIANDVDLLDMLKCCRGTCTFSMIDEATEGARKAALAEMEKADRELARLLQ
ncbi:hypothetical protein L7F22_009544, partial [Adiantum nelumboides]|nr:hypothetical protein [Adiantum nelumboides]